MAVKILGRRSVEDLRRITNKDLFKVDKALKNLTVYVTHRGENALKRRLKITKISNTSASQTKFEIDGNQIDIATYFERTYNRRLQYPFLPCVIVRKTTSLPMEVCNVVKVCN